MKMFRPENVIYYWILCLLYSIIYLYISELKDGHATMMFGMSMVGIGRELGLRERKL